MKAFWDERYSAGEFAYGKAPNRFFAERLAGLPPGRILLPAEGEGRNAVYAAKLGWEVHAFDISEAGREKALRLASEEGVRIHYQVAGCEQIEFADASFDAIGLIFAHFLANRASGCQGRLDALLKVGGTILFEAFSKSHLAFRQADPRAGGPKSLDMLFSVEEVEADFPNYEKIELVEEEVVLAEGRFHQGKSAVVRFVGRKRPASP